jgi:hypothetical protein
MKQDRFLFGILIFIVLLVVVALALFFVRQDTQVYLSEDTPEGVIHNYALAMFNGDYQRAYGYLADEEYKPDYNYFRQSISYNDFSQNAVRIGKAEYTGSNAAFVQVTVIYASNGPFSESWNSSDSATLVQQDGKWRLTKMPNPYWGYDWFQEPAKQ